MTYMTYEYTRSGIGPVTHEPKSYAAPVVAVTYWVPTPKWMLHDGVETRRSMPTSWVGFQTYDRSG